MAALAWTGTIYYGIISFILTALMAIVPVVVSSVSSWFGVTGDMSIGLSWLYLAIVFTFCLVIPVVLNCRRQRLSPKGKAVLITGCDTGFGFLLAKQLDAIGMHVFAGCLLKNKGGEGARKLQQTGSERMKVIQLDVTSDDSVNEAVDFIGKNLPDGAKGLWGLVNNAGISAFGDIEWTPMSLYKNVMEVNMWGVVRTTQACLPLIRRSKGRVVTIASGLCRMMAPSRSSYSVSKYAVNGFMTCLQYEMKRWGVKTSVIEPGNYIAGTNILSKESINSLSEKMWGEVGETVKADYGRGYFDKKVNEVVGYCNSGISDLTPVTDAYEDALLSESPFRIYNPMTLYWRIRLFIMLHLPGAIGEYLYIYSGTDQSPPKKLD